MTLTTPLATTVRPVTIGERRLFEVLHPAFECGPITFDPRRPLALSDDSLRTLRAARDLSGKLEERGDPAALRVMDDLVDALVRRGVSQRNAENIVEGWDTLAHSESPQWSVEPIGHA